MPINQGDSMGKSLLELLSVEKSVLADLELYKACAEDFANLSKKCEGFTDTAADYEKRASAAEKKLISIRKEIKEYFSFIGKI